MLRISLLPQPKANSFFLHMPFPPPVLIYCDRVRGCCCCRSKEKMFAFYNFYSSSPLFMSSPSPFFDIPVSSYLLRFASSLFSAFVSCQVKKKKKKKNSMACFCFNDDAAAARESLLSLPFLLLPPFSFIIIVVVVDLFPRMTSSC